MGFHIGVDQPLAFFARPFVQTVCCIMDITIKKRAVIRIIHDLADGRARTLWYHAVHHALTFGHPRSGKAHISPPKAALRSGTRYF